MSCNKKLHETAYADSIAQNPQVQDGAPYWQQLNNMPFTTWKDEYFARGERQCPYSTPQCQYTTQGEMICKK